MHKVAVERGSSCSLMISPSHLQEMDKLDMDVESCFTVAFDCNYHRSRPFNCTRSIFALFAGLRKKLHFPDRSKRLLLPLHKGWNDAQTSSGAAAAAACGVESVVHPGVCLVLCIRPMSSGPRISPPIEHKFFE